MTVRPFETMEAFSSAIEIVPMTPGNELRAKLLASRLDQSYQQEIADGLRLRPYGDGLAYVGYLWDFLADKRVVTDHELWDLAEAVADVYAMWDLHSVERVRIPDYFRFPRGTVIKASPDVIRRGLAYLPEDLYLFDETCEWVGAITHEVVDDRRFCLWSGREPARG